VNTAGAVIESIDSILNEAEELLSEGQYVLDDVPVMQDIAARPPHQYIGPEHTQGYARRVHKASPGQRLQLVALKAGVSMGQLSSYLQKRKKGMSMMRAAVACKMQVLTAKDVESQMRQLDISKVELGSSVNESRYVHNMEVDPREQPVGIPRSAYDSHASWGTKPSGTKLNDYKDLDHIISVLVAVDPESDSDLKNYCDVMTQLTYGAMHSDEHLEIVRVAIDAVQDYLSGEIVEEDEDGEEFEESIGALDAALATLESMDHGLFEDDDEDDSEAEDDEDDSEAEDDEDDSEAEDDEDDSEADDDDDEDDDLEEAIGSVKYIEGNRRAAKFTDDALDVAQECGVMVGSGMELCSVAILGGDVVGALFCTKRPKSGMFSFEVCVKPGFEKLGVESALSMQGVDRFEDFHDKDSSLELHVSSPNKVVKNLLSKMGLSGSHSGGKMVFSEAFDYEPGEYDDYQGALSDDSVQFDLYGPEDTTIEGLTTALGRAIEANIPDSQPGRIGLAFVDMEVEGEEAMLSGQDSTGREVFLTVSMPKAMFRLELPEADAYVEMKLLTHHPLSNLSLFLQHIGKMLIHDQYVYSEVEQPKSTPGGDR
jgi:hypothetical protein